MPRLVIYCHDVCFEEFENNNTTSNENFIYRYRPTSILIDSVFHKL